MEMVRVGAGSYPRRTFFSHQRKKKNPCQWRKKMLRLSSGLRTRALRALHTSAALRADAPPSLVAQGAESFLSGSGARCAPPPPRPAR